MEKNGVNIAGATSASLLVNATGNYTCMAYSDCDTNTSSIITVTVNKNPKAIISAGGPTTFCPGGNVTLTETPSVDAPINGLKVRQLFQAQQEQLMWLQQRVIINVA
ncbi:MAG: hypothetical protein IPI65_04625 [Bacteroidetes bacterium]|nr:hypothetical protein [Bacteroidota bacterium]